MPFAQSSRAAGFHPEGAIESAGLAGKKPSLSKQQRLGI